MSGRGLVAPIKGGSLKKTKSKLMKPDKETHTVDKILRKNAKNVKETRKKNAKAKAKSSKANKGKNKGKKPKGKGRGRGRAKTKGKRKKKSEDTTEEKASIEEEKETIDPYIKLRETDPNILIRLFLHKMGGYHHVTQHLGQFGEQLQSNMINFANDMLLPTLMSLENVEKFKSIINDRKLIYLLRQSFMRWCLIHKKQMKLLFKRKGEENAKNKLKYDIVVTKNHIIQKLSSALTSNPDDIRDIIRQLDPKTKLAYFHYLKSDIKNPFLAQLMTPIPDTLLSNTKCSVPSLSGKMPNLEEKKDDPNAVIHAVVAEETEEKTEEKTEETDEKLEEKMEEIKENIEVESELGYDNMEIQKKMHGLFDGYKDCVLLSEKQILVDILKTQYKLIQNAIDDYGKMRWMDAPIDHGHIRLMQRELIRDHQQIIHKCQAIEDSYKRSLAMNISEVNKMRVELKKRKRKYLDLIENKCFRFLKEKLSQIHEEIERKKQAIALHEKKRENYLNHAKESLKNEQNMRKGVKLVNDTYHKYLRQMTRAKIEYAEVDEGVRQCSFYEKQEELNSLRNMNDRIWYWYKKEREIYAKSIKSFSRINKFFKKIETFLVKEYGANSEELMMFRRGYYTHVLAKNVDKSELENVYNKEIFEKKRITDIETVYNQQKKDIKLPECELSVVNRLYKNLRPKTDAIDMTEAETKTNGDESGMFVNNRIQRHLDETGDEVMEQKSKDLDATHEHIDSEDSEPEIEEKLETEHSGYTKTRDEDIFGNVSNDATHTDQNSVVVRGSITGNQSYGTEEESEYIDESENNNMAFGNAEHAYVDEESNNNAFGAIDSDESLSESESESERESVPENEDTFNAGMSYAQVIQTASNTRVSVEQKTAENDNISSDYFEEKEEMDSGKGSKHTHFLETAAQISQKKGKRVTQNMWGGNNVESTLFYADGDNKDKNVRVAPHVAKHYSVRNNKLLEDAPLNDAHELAYEDSTQFQNDSDDESGTDENRPSSTVFKNDGLESPGFFKANDKQFFEENESEVKEEPQFEEEYEEEDSNEEEYEHRIKLDNRHEKAQNSLSMSGIGGFGHGYDTPKAGNENESGFGGNAPQPSTPYIEEDEEEEYDDFDDYDANDAGQRDEEEENDEEYSFEDDEESGSSYVASD